MKNTLLNIQVPVNRNEMALDGGGMPMEAERKASCS